MRHSEQETTGNYSGTESLRPVRHTANHPDQGSEKPHPPRRLLTGRERGGKGHWVISRPPTSQPVAPHHPNRRPTGHHRLPYWQQHLPPPFHPNPKPTKGATSPNEDGPPTATPHIPSPDPTTAARADRATIASGPPPPESRAGTNPWRPSRHPHPERVSSVTVIRQVRKPGGAADLPGGCGTVTASAAPSESPGLSVRPGVKHGVPQPPAPNPGPPCGECASSMGPPPLGTPLATVAKGPHNPPAKHYHRDEHRR